MFTVIITEKGGEQRRLDFDKPEVTIGRVQGNDIILPKGNVSKRHSRIVLKDGKFIIVDLKSTNGTYVNGRKITSPLVLKETDKVYIGDFIITVEESVVENSQPSIPAHPPHSQLTGSMTPIPPPVVPSGVYEPAPPMSGTPSLIANPPPAPKRPPPPPSRRPPPPESDDIDMDDGLGLDAPPAPPPPAPPPPVRASGPLATQPNPQLRDSASLSQAGSQAGPRVAPPPAPPPPRGAVGRTTNREEVPPPVMNAPPPRPSPAPIAPPPAKSSPREAPAPVAPPPAATARVAPASPPVILHGGEREKPRSTLKSFDAVSVPPADVSPPAPPAGVPNARLLELQRELVDRVAAQLDVARLPAERLSDEGLWQRAESALADLVEQMEADGALPHGVDQDHLVKDALNDLLGAGPLEELLADDEVTDILVDRSDRILVERAGRLVPAPRLFSSENALRQAIERLLAGAGRKLEAGTTLVDARLPGGTRLVAALPPLSTRGPSLTLRKARRAGPALAELVQASAMSPQMASFLQTCSAARRNVIISGGPSSGKTTFLAALAALIPPSERVISVEEVAELSGGDGRVALEARPAEDGRPGVSFTEVVRAALRMRPDRLIVGEVRGAEALEVLAAMGAGDGSMATVAGDNVAGALTRLESLARLGTADASPRGLRELVAHAAQIVVHVSRFADGVRRVTSIAEVTGTTAEGYATRELFAFQVQGHGPDGLRGRFAGAGVVPRFYEQLEARGEKADPAVFR